MSLDTHPSSKNGSHFSDRKAARLEVDAFKRMLVRTWGSIHLPIEVVDALTYIHEHIFEEEINSSVVRDACGLKNHNMSSVFKKHVGMGMRKYIETHRIEMAKCLLRYPSLAVIEIAWTVGYGNPETFARAFRRIEGCAPTDYRSEFEEGSLSTKSAFNGNGRARSPVKD